MFDFKEWLVKNGFRFNFYNDGADVTFEKALDDQLCVIGFYGENIVDVVRLSTVDADADPTILSKIRAPETELLAEALLDTIGF